MSKSPLERAYPFIVETTSALSELDFPLERLKELELDEVKKLVRIASNALAEARVVLAENDGFLKAD